MIGANALRKIPHMLMLFAFCLAFGRLASRAGTLLKGLWPALKIWGCMWPTSGFGIEQSGRESSGTAMALALLQMILRMHVF
ncbi:hypothetical protein AAC387_Pa05g1890 [Persea americana]